MGFFSSHTCDVPPAPNPNKKSKWKCPECKEVWTYRPDRGVGYFDSFRDVRGADGKKAKPGFWDW